MEEVYYANKEADDSSAEPFLAPRSYELTRSHSRNRWRVALWVFHFTGVAFISLLSINLAMKANADIELACLQAQSSWSPALQAALPIRKIRFNGTLDYPSPFRGSPGPEVDAAWKSITHGEDVGAFGISLSEFRNLDQPVSESTVRLSERQGGGFDVKLEVFHQLHCLNLLRQFTYKEYYSTRAVAWRDSPEMLRTHVDHCIEILRQKIMCDADVGVYTHNWVSRRETPWPNFNVVHQCRNFDGIVEWSKRHNAPYFGHDLTRPKDIAGMNPPP